MFRRDILLVDCQYSINGYVLIYFWFLFEEFKPAYFGLTPFDVRLLRKFNPNLLYLHENLKLHGTETIHSQGNP
mgnify:CR=1 FL=1